MTKHYYLHVGGKPLPLEVWRIIVLWWLMGEDGAELTVYRGRVAQSGGTRPAAAPPELAAS